MTAALTSMVAPVFLAAFIMLLMLQIAFWRNAVVSWGLSSLAVVLAIALCIPLVGEYSALAVTPLLVADEYSLLFTILILFATLITILLARDYLARRAGENEEFYLLVLLSALGAIILVSATHLASFLLGLELLGVALYALIAYPERGHYPLEAATKYLILSGAASAILLFGFALLYAALGTLSFSEIGQQLATVQAAENRLLILAGSGLILTGIGFKLSLVPFHMWTPDVYQGAPSPVTGFLATVSKAAIFAALIRFFIDAELYQYQSLNLALTLVAMASMLAGNLLALRQHNIKRLLAYSSIAHLGYLLIIILVLASQAQQQLAVEAGIFYLIAYVLTSLAAFALLTILASDTRESNTGSEQSIQGLFYQQPLLSIMFMVALLSLAGIPLTAGFVGKFYLFTVGIKATLWWPVAALVIGSGIGIYYYLRLVFSMSQAAPLAQRGAEVTLKWPALLVVTVLLVSILYLGIFPQALITWISGISL